MLVKMKKVYYCEYCGRHRLTPQSIRGHEQGCTANPNRTCGMCDEYIDLPVLIEKYKARFEIIETPCELGIQQEVKWIGEPVTLDEVLGDSEGCPACTLAILRLVGLNRGPATIGMWDYQKAHRDWWAERNAEMERPGY